MGQNSNNERWVRTVTTRDGLVYPTLDYYKLCAARKKRKNKSDIIIFS